MFNIMKIYAYKYNSLSNKGISVILMIFYPSFSALKRLGGAGYLDSIIMENLSLNSKYDLFSL